MIFHREIETARTFKNNLLISSKEVNILTERSGQKNIKEVRPFLNISQQFNRTYQGKPEYIFLGSLNIPHNDYSICYFIEKNIDVLIKEIPNFKLKIIGKHPSDKLIYLCKKYECYIELSGYVENLEQAFSSACAMIIPLQFGSGVKLKTLEALSRGLPVISTSYGIEGISIKSNDIIVDDNIFNFPLYMKQLIYLDTNMKYSLKAYNFYQSNYSKRIVYEMYDKVFNIEEVK
nr:glycosyltransferase family 4 protein [Geobacillus sp. BMUD]